MSSLPSGHQTEVDLTLVVLAAGLSTRFGGLKQLEPVGPAGEAIMDYQLYDAVRAGFSRAVFVVREEIELAMREHLANLLGGSLSSVFVNQTIDDVPGDRQIPFSRAKPWGTAHAVLTARHQVRGPFGVCNADDFYGEDAYRKLAHHLTDGTAIRRNPVAVVGYRLDRTLSDVGGVSRALCERDESSRLVGITELRQVARTPDGIRGMSITGTAHQLHGSETVSMNLWGFTPAVFPMLERQFDSFLRHTGDPDAEFLIPTAIAEQVAKGETSVAVLDTSAEWMGVTFRDDKEQVERRIQHLVAAGAYPRDLADWFRDRE